MPVVAPVAGKGFDFLFTQGVLGAACAFLILLLIIAGFVIRHLDKKVHDSHAVVLADRERLITVLEASKNTAEDVKDVLQSLEETLETRGQAVSDLSTQVQVVSEKVQHGFGNLTGALDGFLRLIDRDRERYERELERERDRGRP